VQSVSYQATRRN